MWNYNPLNDNFYGDHWNGEDFSIFSPEKVAIRAKSLNESLLRSKELASPVPLEKLSRQSRSVAEFLNDAPKGIMFERARSFEMTPTPTTHFDILSSPIDSSKPGLHDGGRALDAVIRPCNFKILIFLDAAKISGNPKNLTFDFKKLYFYFEFTTNKLRNEKHDRSGIEWGQITEIFIPNYHYGDLDVVIEVSDGIYRYHKGRQSIYWRYDTNYRGTSSKETNEFHDEEGLFEFVVSLATFFMTWLLSLFWIAPTERNKKEIVHWIHIRPAKEI